MWNFDDKNYDKLIKYLYNNLKISNNFINKILHGVWQKSDEYLKLKNEERKILDQALVIDKDVLKKMLLKWNHKYQIEYNDFLEKIKIKLLKEDPSKKHEIQELIESNKLIKEQLTDEELDSEISLDNLIKVDNTTENNNKNKEIIIIPENNNDNSSEEIIKTDDLNQQTENNFQKKKNKKIKHKKIKKISKKNKTLEEQENDYDDDYFNNNDTIINLDNNNVNKNFHNNDYKNTENQINKNKETNDNYNKKISEISNDIFKNLDLSLSKHKKDLNKFDKELKNRKDYISKERIKINEKTPNFSKEIVKLKKDKIPNTDIIIDSDEKVFVHKKKHIILVEIRKEVETKQNAISTEIIKEAEKNPKNSSEVPIKIVRTKVSK